MADKAFNIERGIKRELVTQIDKIGFLGLGLNKKNNKSNDYREEGAGAQRIDLFIFAVALGVRDGKRTKLKTSESFIKFSALVDRQDEKAFLYSVALEVLRKENKENKIVDDDAVKEIVEEYANTGFYAIKEMIGDADAWSEDKQKIMIYSLMSKNIEMYEKIVG